MGMTHAWGLALSDILYYRNSGALTSLDEIWPDTENSKVMLRRDWGVTNREELLKEMRGLLAATENKSQQRSELLENSRNLLQPSHYQMLQEYGFLGWDIVRYSFLVRVGHELGFITTEEVWSFLDDVRPGVQKHFPGWYQFGMSYILGASILHDSYDIYFKAVRVNALHVILTHPLGHWRRIDWLTSDNSIPHDVASPKHYNPFHVEVNYDNSVIFDEIENTLHRRRLLDLTNSSLPENMAHRFKLYNMKERSVPWYRYCLDLGNSGGAENIGFYYECGQGGLDKDPVRAEHYYRLGIAEGSSYCKCRLGYMLANSGDQKNYAEAMQLLHDAASSQTSAFGILGWIYMSGVVTERNYVKAAYWYQKAVEANDVSAANNLAVLYTEGNGVGKDLQHAVHLYRHAAQQGDITAARNLAWTYVEGKGVEQNYALAFNWFLYAAEKGNDLKAIYQVIISYYEGRGVKQDYDAAMRWAQIGAETGNTDCMGLLVWFYNDAAGYEDQRDIKKAITIAKQILEITPNDSYAQYQLATMYYYGQTGTPDRVEAFKLFNIQASRNKRGVHLYLGYYYYEDENAWVDGKDIVRALHHFRLGAEEGDHIAQYYAGFILFFGMSGVTDIEDGIRYLEKAAQGNQIDALIQLAYIYYEGNSIDADPQKALVYFQKILAYYQPQAERSDVFAQYYLGKLYSTIDILEDAVLAKKWLTLAAERGHAEAQHLLALYYMNRNMESPDYNQALKYLALSAEQNYAASQRDLGFFKLDNLEDLPEVDYSSALYWLKRAYENGDESVLAQIEMLRAYVRQVDDV